MGSISKEQVDIVHIESLKHFCLSRKKRIEKQPLLLIFPQKSAPRNVFFWTSRQSCYHNNVFPFAKNIQLRKIALRHKLLDVGILIFFVVI